MRRQNTSVLQVEGSRIQRSTVEDQKSGISSFFIFNLINFEFVGFQGRWIMTLQSMYNNAIIIFFMSFASLIESPSTCCVYRYVTSSQLKKLRNGNWSKIQNQNLGVCNNLDSTVYQRSHTVSAVKLSAAKHPPWIA